MLKKLSIKNLTVFPDIEPLEFSNGLNVIVGENGTGKTHLLKLAYALIATSVESGRNPSAQTPTKAHLQKAYADKLMGVFKPNALGRLASRKQGRVRCEVQADFSDRQLNTAISFATNAQSDVQVEQLPKIWDQQRALYLPTRELLTIYPGFVSLYDDHYVPFEETWRDTCVYLGMPLLKGRRTEAIANLLSPLEDAMGGKVVLEKSGHFYLSIPGSGKMEMYLVAEGLRKLAMLAQLISNGVLQEQGYLFWDEPEANLNPRLIRLAAYVIHALAQNNVQVFIATHSYFLLKELELLAKKQSIPQRYFALVKEEGVIGEVEKAGSPSELEHLVTLEEELAQYDREMEANNA